MEENQQVPVSGPENIVPEQPKRGAVKAVVTLIVVVALAAGAWYAYGAYNSPSKVWEKFASSAENIPTVNQTQVTESVSLSYVDNGKVPDALQNNPGVAFFENGKFSVNGTAYVDSADLAHPEMSMDLNYSLGSGNTTFSSSAKMILKDKDVYLNLGDNPFVNSVWGYLAPGEKVEWVKINSDEIAKASGATSTPTADYTKYVKTYQDILNKHMSKVLVLDKFIDRQTIHGVKTLHYSNKVNQQELRAMLSEVGDTLLQQVAEMDPPTDPEMKDAKEVLSTLINDFSDRLQVSTFETWIGATDHKLHKVKLVSNAPSLVSFVGAASDPSIMSIEDTKEGVKAMLKAMTFDGQVSIEEEFYDFGKKQDVKVPDNALDLAKKIEEEKKNMLNVTPLQPEDIHY